MGGGSSLRWLAGKVEHLCRDGVTGATVWGMALGGSGLIIHLSEVPPPPRKVGVHVLKAEKHLERGIS